MAKNTTMLDSPTVVKTAVRDQPRNQTITSEIHQEDIIIRPMQQDDLAQVRAIDQMSFTMPWPESAYQYELNENPLSLLWVAETKAAPDQASQITGMIVVWMILDEAHIATIAVRPDQRGKGIAQLLLAEGLKAAIGRGAHEATLEVRASNIPAQKLYQRFGFEVVGKRVRYYRDNNEDALIMTANGLDHNYLAWLENGVQHGTPYNKGGQRPPEYRAVKNTA